MTDMPTPQPIPRKGSLLVQDARTVKRNRAEARFKMYGIIAISMGLMMLLILLPCCRQGSSRKWRTWVSQLI